MFFLEVNFVADVIVSLGHGVFSYLCTQRSIWINWTGVVLEIFSCTQFLVMESATYF